MVEASRSKLNLMISGHNHIVTSVDWSHTGSRLLTSSDDKTACVWVKGQSDPVMTFDRVVKNTASVESQINNRVSRNIYFSLTSCKLWESFTDISVMVITD